MPDDTPYEAPPEEQPRYLIPPRRKPADDNGYFEILAQAVFQAGFSWKVVHNKWPAFRRAFDGFDIDTVARYDIDDLERLLADPGIVRNGQKIEAVIHNARAAQAIIREHGSFAAFLRSMDGRPYRERNRAISQRFKWLGRTGAFYFLYCVDEDVPHWEDR